MLPLSPFLTGVFSRLRAMVAGSSVMNSSFIGSGYGFGLVFSMVNQVADLPTDEQVVANEYIVEFDNKMKFADVPFKLGNVAPMQRRGAPEVGQHTEEVLLEVCGYDWPEIIGLRDRGII